MTGADRQAAAGAFEDFDELFAARAAETSTEARRPITLRLYGTRWPCGYVGDLPAAAALRLSRLAEDDDLRTLDLTDPRVAGQVGLLAADLIPRPTLDAWLRRGISTEELGSIVLWVFGQHEFGTADGEDGAGEAEAPEAGAFDSSSADGASSSPTSPASTPSTSTSEGSTG